MTKDEIIELAKQAGFRTGEIDMKVGEPIPFIAPATTTTCLSQLCNFAALVAAKEREECAKLCDAVSNRAAAAQGGALDSSGNVMLRQVAVLGSGACARAIRARGEQA